MTVSFQDLESNRPAPALHAGRVIEQPRLPALDGVRGLAILLVLLVHGSVLLRDVPGMGALAYGWIGVDLFFVLSGFLITRILLETREEPHFYRRFYVRRGLRVWPLYFAYLALFLVMVHVVRALLGAHLVNPGVGGLVSIQTPLWMYGLLVQNLYAPSLFSSRDCLAITWSLCIEEHFYLFWPLFVRVFSARALWRGILAVLVLSPVLRLVVTGYLAGASDEVWRETMYRFTPLHLDSLAAGCLLCLVWSGMGPGLRARRLFSAAFVSGLLGSVVCFRFLEHRAIACFCYSALALLFFGLTGLALLGHLRRFWTLPAMRALGRLSYGLYLIHPTIFLLFSSRQLQRAAGLGRYPALGDLLCFAAAVGLSIWLASLSWRFFESRVLTLKARLAP